MQLPPVLYEDAALLAFDKPAGLTIAGGWGAARETNLMDEVHRRLSASIFNVHRLDRDTSGVLLCAKTREALLPLCRAFEKREVTKRYVSLVRGEPAQAEFQVDRGIAPDPNRPGRMLAVARGGRTACTAFRVLRRWRGYALVEAVPATGRTHQIRVHLAWSGCPPVADPIYGNGEGLCLSALKPGYKHKGGPERPLIARVALHAESLAFAHPLSGETVTICAPLPHDLALALKYLDRFAAPRPA
jgi:RluA family pseudouridine synthase